MCVYYNVLYNRRIAYSLQYIIHTNDVKELCLFLIKFKANYKTFNDEAQNSGFIQIDLLLNISHSV